MRYMTYSQYHPIRHPSSPPLPSSPDPAYIGQAAWGAPRQDLQNSTCSCFAWTMRAAIQASGVHGREAIHDRINPEPSPGPEPADLCMAEGFAGVI